MLPWYTKKEKKGSAFGKPDLVRKLDKVFSAYIRLRDTYPSGVCKCISCGRIKPFSEIDCGHFYSRVHMATRWDEDNCNGECKACNRISSDHIIAYRRNLVNKIGLGRVERLEVLAHSQKHWMNYELEEKIEHYKAEVKRLSAEKGIRVSV